MKGEMATIYLKEIKGLGEFKLIFRKNTMGYPYPKSKYKLEIFFNPMGYGKSDLIETYYVCKIYRSIFLFERHINDFIDDAEDVCNVNLSDIDKDIYKEVLIKYFEYSNEEIEESIKVNYDFLKRTQSNRY